MTRDEFLPIWNDMRDRVISHLESFGKAIGPFGDKDFWVVDDDYDLFLIQVEVMALDLLDPPVIYGLRDLLDMHPRFAITVAVVPPRRTAWPRMGLTLEKGLIVDGLKRDHLPEGIRGVRYDGARPD